MKIYLFLFPALLGFCTVNGQTGIGPEAGFGVSYEHLVPSLPFQQVSLQTQTSVRIGGSLDARLNKHIYLQAGVFFAVKGGQAEYYYHLSDSENQYVNRTMNERYLEAPVNVVFKTGMQGKGRFFAGLGASPSYLVGGNGDWNYHGKTGGVPFAGSHTENLTNGQAIKPFDIGMNVTAGYEWASGWYVRLLYLPGIKDIGNAGQVEKNRTFTLSVGYYFGKGRNINQETDDLIDHTAAQPAQ